MLIHKIFFFTFLLLAFIFQSCNEYEFNNPVDTDIELPPPTELTVSFTADTVANINWKHSGASKYSFSVEMSEKPDEWIRLGIAVNTTNFIARYNFQNGIEYTFRVAVKLDNNLSNYQVLKKQITTLGAPTNLTVNFLDDTKAVLNWVDNSTIETSFEIEVSEDGAKYTITKEVPKDTTRAVVEGIYLTTANYHFRVKAKTENNTSGYSNIAQGKPLLNAPSNLTIDFADETKVALTWTDNSTWETYFEIEMRTGGTNFTVVKTVPANTTNSEIASNYLYNTSYYFRLRANSNNNYSFYSNVAIIDMKPTPIITTITVTNITTNSATGGGNVTSEGGSLVTERGVCWSTSQNPTIADNKTSDGTGTGSFTSSITGLSPNTIYYVRAYATNSSGTNYGDQLSFTTIHVMCPGFPTVTYASKTYNTVLIGDQCWLKENLNVGTMINGILDQTNEGTKEKYCYNDNETNCDTYGGLYQWDEAMQYSTTPGTKGICPTGWHIPTYAEFLTLINELGNNGNALKAIGQGTGSGAGTNTSGFSALLGGVRTFTGFFSTGNYADFWSSTEYFASYAHTLGLYGNGSGINFNYNDKDLGFSVRCVQD